MPLDVSAPIDFNIIHYQTANVKGSRTGFAYFVSLHIKKPQILDKAVTCDSFDSFCQERWIAASVSRKLLLLNCLRFFAEGFFAVAYGVGWIFAEFISSDKNSPRNLVWGRGVVTHDERFPCILCVYA